MSLENLLAIRRLARHEPEAGAARKLLSAAKRNLADSLVASITAENRFDAAYKAVMQCATVALWIKGFRTQTSEPGHHQTTLQSLPLTLDLDQDSVIVIDKLRKQRNLADYSGDTISDAALAECRRQAEALLRLVERRVRARWPEPGEAGS